MAGVTEIPKSGSSEVQLAVEQGVCELASDPSGPNQKLTSVHGGGLGGGRLGGSKGDAGDEGGKKGLGGKLGGV